MIIFIAWVVLWMPFVVTKLLRAHGSRDFASVNQIGAVKYEVLAEHKHAAHAHELLAAMPPEVTF